MKYRKNKYISIKGISLNKDQIQDYMQKNAVDYDIQEKSALSTYPIPRLNENFKFIEKTYNLLNEHIKKNITIYSAGEWLLDNFYVIEETVKRIFNTLNTKKYKKFHSIANGEYKDFARIYVLASEIVAFTDSKIDEEILKLSILRLWKRKELKYGGNMEFTNIPWN